MIDMTLALKKWRTHKMNAHKKGVLPLTFDQYVQKISDAGITPADIGNTSKHYHLGRYTDSGDYTPTSCRFIPFLENLKEQVINGGTARMAEKKRGRTKFNDPSVAAQAKKMTGRSKETHPGIAVTIAKRIAKITGRTKETHAGVALAATKNSKPFAFRSPAGEIHEGRNLEEFCRLHGLLGNAMCKLKHGKLKSYKGWTRPAQHEEVTA